MATPAGFTVCVANGSAVATLIRSVSWPDGVATAILAIGSADHDQLSRDGVHRHALGITHAENRRVEARDTIVDTAEESVWSSIDAVLLVVVAVGDEQRAGAESDAFRVVAVEGSGVEGGPCVIGRPELTVDPDVDHEDQVGVVVDHVHGRAVRRDVRGFAREGGVGGGGVHDRSCRGRLPQVDPLVVRDPTHRLLDLAVGDDQATLVGPPRDTRGIRRGGEPRGGIDRRLERRELPGCRTRHRHRDEEQGQEERGSEGCEYSTHGWFAPCCRRVAHRRRSLVREPRVDAPSPVRQRDDRRSGPPAALAATSIGDAPARGIAYASRAFA